MPTYKFIKGKTNYVYDNPNKMPSYTDRILYKCESNRAQSQESIKVEQYDSEKIYISDHIPLVLVARLIK